MLMTSHQNSEGLAKGLLPFVRTARPLTSCLPWNRFDPQVTEWLLSPVKEWPSNRPSKYYTYMTQGDNPADSRLQAGLYVEKGFGHDARMIYVGNQIMDDRWGWHHVLDGFRSGAIPGILAGLPPAAQAQTVIRLFGGYEGAEWGDYLITLGTSGEADITVSAEQPCREMAALASVKSWKDLPTALDTLTSDQWLWVNCYVYVNLGLLPHAKAPDDKVWTDAQVWNRFLEPLLPWISEK
jgi:hypothetical protein